MTQRSSLEDDAAPTARLVIADGLTPFTAKLLTVLGVCFVIGWAVVAWYALRPQEIVADWNSGRQADTQTIAINLTRDGASLFWPQIACGRDGPGYVETELQLYTKIVAIFMGAFGVSEWIGQLVSLLATVATAAMIWLHLGRRYGLAGALVGVLAFLGQRTTTHLATAVMPDALALLAYVAAWAAFYRYAESRRVQHLVLYAVVGTVAMLQKPSMAQLGISSCLLLAMMGRGRLRDYRVWIAWSVMLLVFVAYQLHAHHLYLEYGNTFGVLFGEDRKAPHLRHLFMPKVLWGAALNAVRWGYGYVGTFAFVLLVLMRRVQAEHIALAVGNVVLALVALRYTSDDGGNYYFAPGNLLASSALAALTSEGMRVLAFRTKRIAFAVLSIALGFQLVRSMQLRHWHANFREPMVAAIVTTGKQLRRFVAPGELVAVRSPHEGYDAFWDCPGRVCEPRTFLLSGTRGWTLARDGDPQLLVEAAARGVRYFADPVADENIALSALLPSTADLVWSQPNVGKIWRLHAPPARKP